MTLNVSDDEKLTTGQLRSLLNMKKRKTDKSISGLKKKDLIVLWRQWKARPLESLVFENDLVESVNEVSRDTPIIEIDPIERPEGNETMVSIQIKFNDRL